MSTPVDTPVTTPPDTVATDELEVDQLPPDTLSPKVVIEPAQTEAVPVMAAGVAGRALTVTTWVA